MTQDLCDHSDRRGFLRASLHGAAAAWVTLHWSGIVEASQHAAEMRQNVPRAKLEIFTVEQAAEIEAVAARIIPTDDRPGAREAGVIYFIDRSLATFAANKREDYNAGLPVLQAKAREMFPGVDKFSLATAEQQDAILKALEGQPIFELILTHTITGFLADPARGGNHGEVGWKLIGFVDDSVVTPPFGYYDRDYPGWKPPGAASG
jgi:gluconate 2-dehydrogenase gamma chain